MVTDVGNTIARRNTYRTDFLQPNVEEVFCFDFTTSAVTSRLLEFRVFVFSYAAMLTTQIVAYEPGWTANPSYPSFTPTPLPTPAPSPSPSSTATRSASASMALSIAPSSSGSRTRTPSGTAAASVSAPFPAFFSATASNNSSLAGSDTRVLAAALNRSRRLPV